MKKQAFFSLLILLGQVSDAQEADTLTAVLQLPDIRITAFEQGRRLKELPVAINYLDKNALERFSPTSIVSAVNTMPGARMEERSPGSYRFNIRGSSLRSTFGVRNVKVYFNDIPVTDPGGHTYLNQLGYYNFNSLEIIKGPGNSVYGAGTGGVMLIESLTENEQAGILTEYTTGSFNLHNIYAALSTGSKKLVSRGSYQHQQNDGYRNQSSLNRNVHSWTGIFRINEDKYLKTSFLYGDLFYETPGALTKTEYDTNPRTARPAGGSFPGAEEAKASVRQRTFISGVSYTQKFAPRWLNKSVLYGMFTDLRNPAIRNYGKNSEPHVGGRTIFRYGFPFDNGAFKFDIGGEWQEGFASVSVHKNVNGNPDSLRSTDEINNRHQFAFSQLSVYWNDWALIGGLSWNLLKIKFRRFMPGTTGLQTRKFDDEFSPRISLMKKMFLNGIEFNLYSSASKGFSPPTIFELLPTGSAINLGLNPEEGINYDLGIKASVNKRLYIDLNAFMFSLKNTIVQRRDSAGGDYYINAGATEQHGIETYAGYSLFDGIKNQGLIWLSHTWHDFHYKDFKQLNVDFSGNQMPATAPHTISSGFNLQLRSGLAGTVTYYYSDKIPLNDANSEFADAFHLVGVKFGFQKLLKEKWGFKLMAGADNLLDQKYSLGNDINAAGGRYYNAAPRRNYFVSVMVQWISKKIFQ